jgi:hypothetical protein
MIQAVHWTPILRLAHGLDITADVFVQGIVLTWHLSPPDSGDRRLTVDRMEED